MECSSALKLLLQIRQNRSLKNIYSADYKFANSPDFEVYSSFPVINNFIHETKKYTDVFIVNKNEDEDEDNTVYILTKSPQHVFTLEVTDDNEFQVTLIPSDSATDDEKNDLVNYILQTLDNEISEIDFNENDVESNSKYDIPSSKVITTREKENFIKFSVDLDNETK